jgi:hypothetical protein
MKYLAYLIFLLISAKSFSQNTKDSIPEFGKIDKSELLKTACAYDKNAEAEVIFDTEEVECIEYPGSVFTRINHHIAIKIYKDKGLSEADIKLRYISYQNDENIKEIKAMTYNLDGSGKLVTTELDKKSIYGKPINKMIAEKIFTFPEVKTGSVIEYFYKEEGTVGTGLKNWNFQKSIPVRFSRYILSIPENIEISSQDICTLPVVSDFKKEHGNNIRIFSMQNIPALRDEPYITCEDDYLQRVESRPIAITYSNGQRTSLGRSWPSIVRELMEDPDFGQQLTRNIPRTDDLEDSLKKVAGSYEKMAMIFRYVRNNMVWNGRSNIWALNGVKSAWKEKKGTAGEVNLILINLLRDAGLEARPVLVSTRENGIINTLSPGFDQFDKVMAYVNIDDHNYVLDATDKYASPKLIPWEVMYSEGLIIEKYETYNWGWKLLWDEKQSFRDIIIIIASIDEKGEMAGNASIVNYDYSRARRLPDLKKGKDKFIDKYFTSQNPGIKVDSVSIENEETDTLPLVENLRFVKKLNSSGQYKYFTTNLFTGLEKNLFTADYRFSDIFFGANQDYTITAQINIPEGYVFDELPKNIKMMMPDTSIVLTRLLQVTDGVLSMRTRLEFKKPYYKVDDYQNFREFYKKLFEFLSEQIVIKKKD